MMQQLASGGQTNGQKPINENFETVSPVAVFGKRHPATTGLVYAYYGAQWGDFAIADGTVSLTNTSANYVVVERATGTVTASTTTTNWLDTADYARIGIATTALGTIVENGWVDHRVATGGALEGGSAPPGGGITALTGDVTASGTGSVAATIANDAVTYAKIQNVSATDKLLGRSTAGAGDVEEITCTAFARTILDDVDAAAVRATIGAGTGGGDASTNTSSSVDSEIALFSGTSGKTLKRASTTGILKGASGVLSAATAGTDYYAPGGTDVAVADGGTGSSTASAARTALGLAIGTDVQAFDAQLSDVAGITYAQGDILYFNGTNLVKLAAGTSGQFLKTAGSGANPSWDWQLETISIACSDETSGVTAGAGKVTFRLPGYAYTLVAVYASLTTAQASGSIFTVDINEAGTSVLSTKLTIDNTEKTSTAAAAAAVISDSALAADAEMSIDVDQIGNGSATGLKVYLVVHKS